MSNPLQTTLSYQNLPKMIPPTVEIALPTKQLLADEANIYIQNLKQQILGLDSNLPVFFNQLDSLIFTNSLLRASAIKAKFYSPESNLAKISRDFDESVNLLRDYNSVGDPIKGLLDQITDIMSQIINEYCYEMEPSSNWMDLQNKLFDQIQEHLLLNLNNLEILQTNENEPFNLDDIPEALHLFDIDFDVDSDGNTDDDLYLLEGTHLNELDGFIMIQVDDEVEDDESNSLEWIKEQDLLELTSDLNADLAIASDDGDKIESVQELDNADNAIIEISQELDNSEITSLPMPEMLAEIFLAPVTENLLGSDDETELQGVSWNEQEDITNIQEDLIVEDLDDPWIKFSSFESWSPVDEDELSTLEELEASFNITPEDTSEYSIAVSIDDPLEQDEEDEDDDATFWKSLESIGELQSEPLEVSFLEEITFTDEAQAESGVFLETQPDQDFSSSDVDTAIEESPIYQNNNVYLDLEKGSLLDDPNISDTDFNLEDSSPIFLESDLNFVGSLSLGNNEQKKRDLDTTQEREQAYHLATITNDASIRLPINHLEMLGDLAEELLVRKGSLDIYLGEIKAFSGEARKSLQLLDHNSNNQTAIADLQSNLEQILNVIDQSEHQAYAMGQDVRELRKNLRQVLKHPISSIVRKYPRILRDLSLLYGNQVELIVKGAEISIERILSEIVAEPLELLLRNAVEYGIETLFERQQMQKCPQGKIEIIATQTEEGTVIKVSDDGRGINLEKIRQQLENSATIAGMSDFSTIEMGNEQLMGLLFDANFNISREPHVGSVTKLSDIRKKLRDVGGTISVQSQMGEGTEFTIVLPNLLALVRVMLIDINQMCLAIPSKVVLEVIPIESDDPHEEGQTTLLWRDRKIPVLRLNSSLKLNCRHNTHQLPTTTASLPFADLVERYKPANAVSAFLIIHHDNHLFALHTDGCWNDQDATFHHIEGDISLASIFLGTVILGSNQAVALINPAELAAEASRINIPESIAPPSNQGIDNLKILSDFFGNDDVISESSNSFNQANLSRVSDPENLESSGLMMNASGDRQTKRSHQPKVLIVEASANVRRYLAMTLTKSGFLTEQVQDGNEAFAFLKNQLRRNLDIDVVITDLELPHMDGFKLLTNIRADEALNRMPVVVLTSRNNDHDQKLALELGASAYFSKPYREQELVSTLQNIIG
ncbi:response regulator [Pseudanabaena sp. FACHB-1998]|uniref:ATP-binding response regulator n=1 Tax=Pseudanabaena sp. FACHB-1998 TaxID=2692858 RepID=UPI00167FFB0E|nr:response regulator [Pseudanabaena sp. FACHB-1998]MBD2176930.1 response regulator [Pseudanabaena sp. FACHB-1998]